MLVEVEEGLINGQVFWADELSCFPPTPETLFSCEIWVNRLVFVTWEINDSWLDRSSGIIIIVAIICLKLEVDDYGLFLMLIGDPK